MIFKEIMKIVCAELGIDIGDMSEETTWENLGIDSIRYIGLLVRLENEFDVLLEDGWLLFEEKQKIFNFIWNIERTKLQSY